MGYADPFNRGTYPWGRRGCRSAGVYPADGGAAKRQYGTGNRHIGSRWLAPPGMVAWRREDENGSFIICVNAGEGALPLPDAAKGGETVFTVGRAEERRLEGQSAVIRRIK